MTRMSNMQTIWFFKFKIVIQDFNDQHALNGHFD